MATLANTPSDEDLVRRARSGDRESFSELVYRYQDQIYTLACRTVGDGIRAQDVAQEAFVRAWRGLAAFQEKSKFSSWLYRITYNCCLTELRRRGQAAESFASETSQVAAGIAVPELFTKSLEQKDLIERLLQDLSPALRHIIVLHYLQGLDCQEVAEVTGRPVGTIKAYLHRARAQLRRYAGQLLETNESRPRWGEQFG